MTPNRDASATIPTATAAQDRPADPRPAWERIAYTWLQREVDAGQPVDPATLAGEIGVAPGLARDLVRVLRAHRQRDPSSPSCAPGWSATSSPTPTLPANSPATSGWTRPRSPARLG